jgi:uncharacterized protein YxeA
MKLLIALVLFLSFANENVDGHNISLHSGTVFLYHYEDMEQMIGVEHLDANLYIFCHSTIEDRITDFTALRSLRTITGYLAIFFCGNIPSLVDLRNLESVEGNTLLSHTTVPGHEDHEDVGVAVMWNENTTTDIGMCFADTFNWTRITSTPVEVIYNKNDCPQCDDECSGCWGVGPRLCQKCENFLSGITCVQHCPGGSFINLFDMTCQELIPDQMDPPDLFVINTSHVQVSWMFPNLPNGVILGYRVLLDGEPVWTNIIADYLGDGMEIAQYLPYETIIGNLSEHTYYQFQVQAYDNKGWSTLSNISEIVTQYADAPTNLAVFGITQNSAVLEWQPSHDPDHDNHTYHIEIQQENSSWVLLTSGYVVGESYSLDQLDAGVRYRFRVRTIEIASHHSDYYLFMTLESTTSTTITTSTTTTMSTSTQTNTTTTVSTSTQTNTTTSKVSTSTISTLTTISTGTTTSTFSTNTVSTLTTTSTGTTTSTVSTISTSTRTSTITTITTTRTKVEPVVKSPTKKTNKSLSDVAIGFICLTIIVICIGVTYLLAITYKSKRDTKQLDDNNRSNTITAYSNQGFTGEDPTFNASRSTPNPTYSELTRAGHSNDNYLDVSKYSNNMDDTYMNIGSDDDDEL